MTALSACHAGAPSPHRAEAATADAAATPKPAPVTSAEVARVLDDWHDAAASADEARYFGHLSSDSVFLGTDATERWDVAAFRAYAHPHFAALWRFDGFFPGAQRLQFVGVVKTIGAHRRVSFAPI